MTKLFLGMEFNSSKTFFSQVGLTSTSANYIANIAKEIVDAMNFDKNFSFLTKSVKPISDNASSVVLSNGITEDELGALKDNLTKKAALHSLIAYLREAIKAKDHIISEHAAKKFSDWVLDNLYPDEKVLPNDWMNFGIDVPEAICKDRMTVEKYVEENMSIKDVQEYLLLESLTSTFGKFIHPNGLYAVAKNEMERLDGTTTFKETPSANLVYTYEGSISHDKVVSNFFELQDKYREYQKRFNEIRFNIEKKIQEYNDALDVEMRERQSEISVALAKVAEIKDSYMSKFIKESKESLQELRKLKIAIPKNLQDIYKYVQNYGKNNVG